MNILSTLSTTLLLATGLAVGTLSSCVSPYDSHGGATVGTYQPGYRISSLPSGYRREVISGSDYYYHNGSYYRRQSGGYVVVDAPRTSRYYSDYDRRRSVSHRDYRDGRNRSYDSVRVITRLPSGYRVVNHGGSEYYQAGDQYYRRQANGYITVSRPY